MNITTPLFCVGVTLAAYCVARAINARHPVSITNPVVVATPCIIIVLLAAGIDFPTYRGSVDSIAALLGPATVALAVPLFKHRAVLRRYAPSACIGMAAGGLMAILAGVLCAKAFGLSLPVVAALGIKSATAPIAVQLAPIVAADPGLAAVFAIATGMTGAVLGPSLLNLLGIRDPAARGLAYGAISHGIGTTQATTEGELQGAVSGVAMGCSAVLVSLSAPRILPLLM